MSETLQIRCASCHLLSKFPEERVILCKQCNTYYCYHCTRFHVLKLKICHSENNGLAVASECIRCYRTTKLRSKSV